MILPSVRIAADTQGPKARLGCPRRMAPPTHANRPATEDSYSVTRLVDGQKYHLSLTDTAGQEEYRGLWAASNLKSADAFLLVYDITKADSLASLDHFLQLIEMESEQRMEFAGGGGVGAFCGGRGASAKNASKAKIPPVKIIAGNKCDLARVRQVRSAQGLEYARKHGCGFMETSAKNMVNIEETFAREYIYISSWSTIHRHVFC